MSGVVFCRYDHWMTFYTHYTQIIFRLLVSGIVIVIPFHSLRAQNDASSISGSYRGMTLGMTPAEVKELLLHDSWFNYRGEPDVSMLERPGASLIDAGGSLFIRRGIFQFEDDSLSVIMLELNPETIDWFTVYTTLEERYGSPEDMNPQKAWWEDGKTRLALERPLTVKYLDLSVFQASQTDSTNRAAWRARSREKFLDEF